ncbi:MAG: acyl-CoA thioesterase [Verrucomicrobia bacterium]|nr:acyl-CoA thioesterase [Verrucomicrobiota bacterium]
MFTYRTQVRLGDTDATGVLYFPMQFSLALEAYEQFLKERGFSWGQLLASPYLMPVRHAEADYLAPLRCGDRLEVTLHVERLGTSSITLNYLFTDPDRNLLVGKARVVHVVVDRETRLSVPIPPILRSLLEEAIV